MTPPYVQDELGHWYEAVRSNEAALERRPHFAPSKYNAAVSHAKLGQYQRAYASLRSIEPGDQFARKVLESAEADTELWDALKDAHWKRRILYAVRSARNRLPEGG